MLFPVRDQRPRARFPAATLLIVAANVVVFLFQQAIASQSARAARLLVLAAGAIPYEIVNRVDLAPRDLLPVPGSLGTSMFLHGGWMHLIGNMWFLWLFGDDVEEAMGTVRFALFYLLVGIIGALAQCYSMPESRAPMIGASGAVAGVLGGYAMLYPRARVLASFVELPAWFVLGCWFLGQFLLPTGSGIAWMAHVGGFLAGVGAVRLLARSPAGPAGAARALPARSRLRT